MFKLPKDDDKYQWTNHVKDKMIYYRISESLIKRIVRFPKRKEEGIAPRTIAVMQPRTSFSTAKGKSGKKQEEIWVMYQEVNQKPRVKNQHDTPNGNLNNTPKLLSFYHDRGKMKVVWGTRPKIRIISVWRYPGISPLGKQIPIPDEILQELKNLVE